MLFLKILFIFQVNKIIGVPFEFISKPLKDR